MDAISALRQRTVMVLANSKDDSGELPQLVRDALKSPEAGRYIPKTIIVDADLKQVIAIVPYNGNGTERGKLFREAKKKIAASQKN